MEEMSNTAVEQKEIQLTDSQRLDIIEDGLRKKYLSRLNEMEVYPLGDIKPIEEELIDNVRLFHVTEMVYQKGEKATDKFTTVFNTLSSYNDSVFVIIDSDGEKTDFYVGVRNNDADSPEKCSSITLGDTLKNTLVGSFPGIKLQSEDRDAIQDLSDKIIKQKNVASVSVKGSFKDEKGDSGSKFVQGLEELILAMQGRKYIGLIIADSESSDTIESLRQEYQSLYSKLSPFQKVQHSDNETISESRSQSFFEMDTKHKAATIGGAIAGVAGAAIGTMLNDDGLGTMLGGQIGGQLGSFINSLAPAKQISNSSSTGTTTTYENKKVTDLLNLLDEALKHTNEFDSYGMWSIAGYFASDDMSNAIIASSNYRSLMNGDKSGRELAAINSWRADSMNTNDYKTLTTYLSRFSHPVFYYGKSTDGSVLTNAATAISGKELGLHIGIPRSTTSGLPVVEHAEYGKEVYSYSSTRKASIDPKDRMTLGKIYDLGQVTDRLVELDNRSLNMHTFITGSTGSGKSNTVYQMLNELHQDQIPFLVVEPAKGEYKDVFGSWEDVNVFSTNPNVAQLLNINPFKFPDSIHVLEHVDGLVEIFSVCWPMYDAMPAFFKDAILHSYESVGWDLGSSTFEGEQVVYPDFSVLCDQLDKLISESDYASDIKSNYRGALLTRVKSLTVGLNKYIFTDEQTPYKSLFDDNCILDLSRVKSGETKALLMGLMVYILNEYRMDQKTVNNSGLKHITVLEEAHNLLKNTKGSNDELVGKSVEMLTQTIAEIRTYGEGFIIVDQSPSSVDIAAIKNTNTKIVLRTPEANDREAAGRSMGLTTDQVNEIAKLPSGVAVVYQNDWANPVLTMINKARVKEIPYKQKKPVIIKPLKRARTELISALMQPWLNKDRIRYKELLESLKVIDIRPKTYKMIEAYLNDYVFANGVLTWSKKDIPKLQICLMAILGMNEEVLKTIIEADDHNALRAFVKEKTKGLEDQDIEEVCSVIVKVVE